MADDGAELTGRAGADSLGNAFKPRTVSADAMRGLEAVAGEVGAGRVRRVDARHRDERAQGGW